MLHPDHLNDNTPWNISMQPILFEGNEDHLTIVRYIFGTNNFENIFVFTSDLCTQIFRTTMYQLSLIGFPKRAL